MTHLMSSPPSALLLSLAPLLPLLPLQEGSAQESVPERDPTAFEYTADELVPGTLYQYRHSNIDGTHESRVSLYLASPTRLESLKWGPGWERSTRVVAEMDWKTFSVKSFETTTLHREGPPRKVAELVVEGGRVLGKAGGNAFSCAIAGFPWHSYDFDLASLNVSMRFLRDPESTVILGIVDARGSRLADQGWVELAYEAVEERSGQVCRKYSLNGPGLDDRGGFVWSRKDGDRAFVSFEIDLPDEPGFENGRLELLETTQASPEAWQELLRASVR